MPLMSRIVSSSLRNRKEDSIQILRRICDSKRFSTSIITRSSASRGVSCPPLPEHGVVTVPKGLNCFKEYGLSKRFYSSSTRSNNNSRPPYALPEEAVSSTVSWKAFLVPGSVIAGISGLFLFLHYNDERRAVPKGQGEKFQRSAVEGPIIGGPFSLIDTEGRVVTEKNLMGNWVLLYFGYTSSPDVGPAEVRKMANAVKTLESRQKLEVLPVFVTIDPHRDTPSQLRAYLGEFDSRIVGLTGPVAAIRQMAQEYRVYFKKVDEEGDDYLVESSHNMYLINPNMEVARSFGVEYSAEELAEAIAKEMNKKRITIVAQN